MRLTKASEYAIRSLLFLAGQKPGAVASRREIAKAMDIPYQFLGKIGPTLAAAGLIRIVQGAKGGFRLARPAGEISLLDAIEAVEGEIFLNDCLMAPGTCHRSPACPVHQVWSGVTSELRRVLASADFADLAAREAGNKSKHRPAASRK
ncbi:MAG: Rrf2 family transcriptional regulator [Thermodesulfobacteriota bacterium]